MPETFASQEIRSFNDRLENSRQLVDALAWEQAKEEATQVAAKITRVSHQRVAVTSGQGK